MKNRMISLLMLSLGLLNLYAQTQNDLLNAFKESYSLEAEGKFLEAAATLKKIYQTDHYETNLRLGWLYYSAGEHTTAMPYYQKCAALRPLSLEARFGFILPAAALGHWDQVLAKYQEILNIDPFNTKANFYAGQIYYYRADYVMAEKYFQKVVNLFPFDYDSLIMLAWTKYFLGKSSEAKTLFNKVLLYNPTDESALEGLQNLK